MDYRENLKNKKKIVVKIGSSSLTHAETGNINYKKLEKLVRVLSDLKSEGRDVVLVSSGAISVGRARVGINHRPNNVAEKQACAAIGQCQLMMAYQRLFSEYSQLTGQILLTKYTLSDDTSRHNARNTFNELFKLGAIPIVNENDTVATEEIEIGDNDSLSALVAALIGADLLILLSDIDGLYTDDPNVNPDARFIETVEEIDDKLMNMAKGSHTDVGTGGMSTKITAGIIATQAGTDMVIANSRDLEVIEEIVDGKNVGTLFIGNRVEHYKVKNYL